MKVEGSTETLGLLKHCTYSYTISTRVTFLFLSMFLSPGYRTIFKNIIMYFASSLPQRACVLELVYVTCSKWRRGELLMLVKVASAKMICVVRVFLTQKQQREKANI